MGRGRERVTARGRAEGTKIRELCEGVRKKGKERAMPEGAGKKGKVRGDVRRRAQKTCEGVGKEGKRRAGYIYIFKP